MTCFLNGGARCAVCADTAAADFEINHHVFLGELKHEVLRKSVKLSFHSLVEVEACHLIELGEVASREHDFTLADEVDPALDHFQGDDLLLWGLFLRQILSLLNIGALSNPPFYLSLPPDLSQQTSRFHGRASTLKLRGSPR